MTPGKTASEIQTALKLPSEQNELIKNLARQISSTSVSDLLQKSH